MPIGTLLGGIGSGLMGGMEKGQELQLRREESKLRTKMLDAQIKHMDAQQRTEDQKQINLQNLMTTRRDTGNAYERAVIGSTPGAPMTEEPGDPAIGTEQVAGQPGAGVQGRAMQPHEMLIKAALQDYAHPIPAGAFRNPALDDTSEEGMFNSLVRQQNVVNRLNAYNAANQQPAGAPQQPPGVVPVGNAPQATPPTAPPTQPNAYRPTFTGSKGPKLAPTPAAASREPLSAEGRIFAIYEKIQKGLATPEEKAIFTGWVGMPGNKGVLEQMRFNAAHGSGAGSQTGALDVKDTPRYLENQTDIKEAQTKGAPIPESADTAITSMRTILSQLDRIDPKNPKSLYNPAYIGPVASKQGALKETFGETPIIGGLVGGAIGSGEAQFRQVVNGVYNEIANLRGGKVLPEQELKRIEQEAITLSKSPAAFEARYAGFRTMVEGMLKTRMGNVATSRGRLNSGGTPAAAPTGGAPDGTRKILNNKPYIKQEGQWYPE